MASLALQTLTTEIVPELLGIFGLIATLAFCAAAVIIMWQYPRSRRQSFRWHARNWHLKRLSAVACLFFLAMTASCWVVRDDWAWVYFMLAAQAGVWWMRRAINQRV